MSLSHALAPIVATLLAYVLLHTLHVWYRDLTSPLRHVVGPPSPSLILGNFKEMADNPHLAATWRKKFGHNFRFRGLFGISELHTSDMKALNHIVTNSAIYQKPDASLDSLQRILGKGLFTVERDEHKRQKPAFSVGQIRLLTEIFVEKAVHLRDIWAREVVQNGGQARIEVLSWLGRMTLDVIGQAGVSDSLPGPCFGYEFNALAVNEKPSELNKVFGDLLHSPKANLYAVMRLAQSLAPILKLVPVPGWRVARDARKNMFAIGKEIVTRSKASLDASVEETKALSNKRDLLSVILKANVSSGVANSQRLTEAEMIAQIPTFLLAGHETTSTAIAWTLHALSLNVAAQTKLREELFTVGTDNPTMDELDSLPYLEKVLREAMRTHSPIVFIQRKAMEDDVLPLSQPYIDKEGIPHDSLPIPKGQMIHLPLLAVNTSKDIWGEDAEVFRPERWEIVPDAASSVPSIWANLFTFFAGPHNCIGFRFSLAEMKATLFILIRAFEILPAVPKGGIGSVRPGLIQRPTVLGEVGQGSGLPLILRAVDVETI